MLDAKSIGEKVYQVRKVENHKTQEQLAEMIDMSKDAISKIERGEVIPKMNTLMKIAEVTDKPIGFF